MYHASKSLERHPTMGVYMLFWVVVAIIVGGGYWLYEYILQVLT